MLFGERIKQLREERGLLQRQLAASLDMDTPMFSKIERGERKAKREQITLLAKLLTTSSDELLTLWLADQVYDVVKDETVAFQAIDIAQEELKTQKKGTRKK